MNQEIENLVSLLQNKCKKEGISLVIGSLNPEKDEAQVIFSGTAAMQAITVALVNGEFKKQMTHNDCDCPVCLATKEMMFHE